MESKKKIINTHIRAIFRECCIIMGGRNNKLKDKNDLGQKVSGTQRNPAKENLSRVKRIILKAYGWTKFIYIKFKTIKQ